MEASCNIFARKRNRETGLLTTTSNLHKELLNLGKKTGKDKFNRKRANEVLFLSQSPKFLKNYGEELIFDSLMADSEPNLASVWEALRKSEMRDITFEDMRKYLSNENGEGEYSFEEGLKKVTLFNKSKVGGHTFIGSIKRNNNGKYYFSVVPNTKIEQEKLIKEISNIHLKERIDRFLTDAGVGVVEDSKSYYNTIDPVTLEGGLLGLIHIRNGIRSIKDLCYETGHFLIGALGKDNILVKRLKNIVSNNPSVVIDLLGEEEYSLYAGNEQNVDEFIGHIVGKTLEKWEDIEPKGVIGTIKSFIKRMAEYLQSRLAITDRELKIALYDAKYIAYDIVKSMMGNNFKGTLNEALLTRLRLEGDANPLLNSLTTVIKELNLSFNTLKDSSKTVFKNYKRMVSDRTESLIKLVNKGTADFNDWKEVLEDSVEEFLKIAEFLLTEANVASDLLALAYRGVKDMGNEEFTMKELAEIVRYNETVIHTIGAFIAQRENICNNIFEFGNPNQLEALLNSLYEAFNLLESAIAGQVIENKNSNGIINPFISYSKAIYEVRRKIALNLLIEANGDLFIAIDLYVHFQDGKLMRSYNPDLVDLKAEILQTSINPPFAYINRFIEGMAESPDYVNLLVHLIVETLKFKANQQTLELKEKLNYLYKKLRSAGLDNTDIFFERDDKGMYTGNLISDRDWGAWEAAYKQYKKNFDDWFFENKRNSLRDDIKNSYTRSTMYSDFAYISSWEQARKSWLENNASRIDLTDKDGNAVTDPITGEVEKIYAPALKSDAESAGKNTYESLLYEKLKKENPKAIEWLNEYLKLKRELDEALPKGGTNAVGVRAPLFTSHLAGRLKGAIKTSQGFAEGASSVMGVTLRNFCSYALSESPNDTEYGTEEDTYSEDELRSKEELIFNRAHSNALSSIKRVPVYGVRKLLHMEELSTDLIRTTLAYGAMAYSYKELNSICLLVLQLPELLKDRKVDSDRAIRFIPRVNTPDSYARLEDYINMLVFNIYTDNRHIYDTRMMRKILGKLTRFGSVYFLGFNMHSAIVNAFTGMKAIMKESWTNEEISFKSFFYAFGTYIKYWTYSFGTNVANIAIKSGSMVESSNKMDLFFRMFDVGDENQRNFRDYYIMTKGYGIAKGYLFSNMALSPYSFTDAWMQGMTFLMGAMCTKLHNKTTDETLSVWDAYKVVKDSETGENKLVLKGNPDDWEIKDKNLENVLEALIKKLKEGKILTPDETASLYKIENGIITKEYNSTYQPWDDREKARFKVRIRSINNRMHGVYNSSDGGALMKCAFMTPILSLKKYAIGLIDSEISRARYDLRTRQMRLGTTTTALILLLDLVICINLKSNLMSGETGRMKKLEEIDLNFKIRDHEVKAFTNAFKLIFGICKFVTIASTGGFIGGAYLRRRGYSTNQIANIRRFWGRIVMTEIFKSMMHICAPPDEEEDSSTFATRGINELLKFLGQDSLEELTKGEWGEEISKCLTKGHIAILQLLSKVTPITGDDDYYLDERTLEEAVKKLHDSIPFSIKGMIYYHAYRALMEEASYNTLDIVNGRHALTSEVKSVILNITPASASALIDLLKICTEMYDSKTYDEIQEMEYNDSKEVDQYAQISPDKFKKVFVRGEKEGYIKGIRSFLGTGFNPFRTMFTELDGYESKKNYDWFRQQSERNK